MSAPIPTSPSAPLGIYAKISSPPAQSFDSGARYGVLQERADRLNPSAKPERQIRQYIQRQQPPAPTASDAPNLDAKQHKAAEMRQRIAMLDKARSLLWRKDVPRKEQARICLCSREAVPLTSHVALRYKTSKQSTFYGQFQRCNSPACPICAPRRAEEMRIELGVLLAQAEAKGLHVYLVTLTLSHSIEDQLVDLKETVKQAFNALFSGKRYQKLQERFALVGKVKVWEPPFGANGWHPHLHTIFLSERQFSAAELDDFSTTLKKDWQARLSRLGAFASHEHGVDVQAGNAAVADYVAKAGGESVSGWGLENELTKGDEKHGRKGSLTPLQLLAAATGDKAALIALGKVLNRVPSGKGLVYLKRRAEELWVEYYQAFFGAHRIEYSKGLKQLLDLKAALEAYELANPSEDDVVDLALVERGEDDQNLKRLIEVGRAELLIVGMKGNYKLVEQWLKDNAIVGYTPVETVAVCDPDGNVTLCETISPSAEPVGEVQHVGEVQPQQPAAPSAPKKGEAAQQPQRRPSAAPAAPSAPKRADPDVPHKLPFFDAVEGKKGHFVYA